MYTLSIKGYGEVYLREAGSANCLSLFFYDDDDDVSKLIFNSSMPARRVARFILCAVVAVLAQPDPADPTPLVDKHYDKWIIIPLPFAVLK